MQHARIKDSGEVHQAVWTGCYNESWAGICLPDAFAH